MSIKEEVLVIAAEWVRRMEHADLSEADLSDFEAWLEESDENRTAFEAAQEAWTSTYVDANAIDEVLALAPEVEHRATEHLASFWRASWLQIMTPRRGFAIGGLFASMAAIIIVFTMNTETSIQEASFAVAQTTHGESETVNLADGSVIELNTSTSVGYRYTDQKREVRLIEGEAFFDVEKDSQRNFEIAVGPNSVTVIGTSFNLKYVDHELNLSVVEGIVSLTPEDAVSSLRVAEGERVIIQPTGQVVRGTSNSSLAMAWRNGAIAFENQTLPSILRDIDRYFPEQLEAGDLEGNEVYTGLIYVDDLDEVLNQLSSISETEINFDPRDGLEVEQ